jgi:hypothetical protein
VAVTLGGQPFTSTDAPDDLGDHVEVVLVDVGQRELDALELGHLEEVRDELLR